MLFRLLTITGHILFSHFQLKELDDDEAGQWWLLLFEEECFDVCDFDKDIMVLLVLAVWVLLLLWLLCGLLSALVLWVFLSSFNVFMFSPFDIKLFADSISKSK